MAAEKAWLKAFTSGSKALQDRLRKVHANNPEFQSFLGKHGFEGGSSVKQASKAQTVSKEVAAKRAELSDKAYGATTGAKVGGEHGSSDEYKDTTVPLTKDQHSKVQAAKKAALTKDERFAAIARASRKSKTGERYEVPTEDPDDAGHEDLRDLHHSLHIGHGSSLDEAARRTPLSQKDRMIIIKNAARKNMKTQYDSTIKNPLVRSSPEEIDAMKSIVGIDHNEIKRMKDASMYEASMKGMPFTDAEKARLAKYDQADKQKINKRVTTRKYEGDDAYSHAVFVDGKPVITGLHKSQVKHYMKQASDKLNEEVELDEATKAYKDPITGQVTQIPAHKAPTYGFNKFGQFASLDRVPKPRKKLHNTAHQLMRTVDEFEEGSPERQAVTDALKKVVGAIKEGFDDPKQIAKYLADKHGAENVRPEHIKTLERDSNSSLDVDDIMQHVRRLQEEVKQLDEVDMDFVQNFIAGGLALQGIDYAKDKLKTAAGKAYAKYMSKKAKDSAPAQTAVSEASLAADIQRDVDARNKRLADAAAKAKKKEAAAAKAAAPKPEKKPKIDDDAVWQHVQSKFSHHPDKDPVDSLRPVMQKHGIEDFNYFNKLARKHGHDNIYDAHHEIAGSEAELQEANFKYDVDHMPGQTVRGTLPTSCPTCYGRKAMYKTPEGKLYADKKTEDSKRVACPDCQGKGYVKESSQDSNYLNNKKNQIRESILGKLAAKMGKK